MKRPRSFTARADSYLLEKHNPKFTSSSQAFFSPSTHNDAKLDQAFIPSMADPGIYRISPGSSLQRRINSHDQLHRYSSFPHLGILTDHGIQSLTTTPPPSLPARLGHRCIAVELERNSTALYDLASRNMNGDCGGGHLSSGSGWIYWFSMQIALAAMFAQILLTSLKMDVERRETEYEEHFLSVVGDVMEKEPKAEKWEEHNPIPPTEDWQESVTDLIETQEIEEEKDEDEDMRWVQRL